MSFELYVLLSFTIVGPAVAGLIRIWRVNRDFIPFILLVFTGLVTESTSYYLITHRQSNVPVYNFYSLTEIVLVLWQFLRWGLLRPWVRGGLLLLFGGFWLWENISLGWDRYNSFFLIGYGVCITILSVITIARMLFFESYALWRNPKFLICAGFLVFFVCAVLVEIFMLYGLGKSKIFRVRIYEIMPCVNVFANLLFTISILWMPTKFRFTIQW